MPVFVQNLFSFLVLFIGTIHQASATIQVNELPAAHGNTCVLYKTDKLDNYRINIGKTNNYGKKKFI